MAKTYTVKHGWKHKPKGYTNPTTGVKYYKRRKVYTYEYGNINAIKTSYEYKKPVPQAEPKPKTERASGTGTTVLTDAELLAAAESAAASGGGYSEQVNPLTGETYGSEILTSGQEQVYEQFTNYLDSVDFYNKDLMNKLKGFFDVDQIKYNYTDEEKNEKINKEYMLHKAPKRNWNDWNELTMSGIRLDVPELYEPPSLVQESSEWSRFVEEFQYGANWMWQPIKQTGVPQILAMGLAGMPSTLTKSMVMSTQMMGIMNRMSGQQDATTAMIGNLQDMLLDKRPGTDTENYKAQYMALNEQAKRRGIIKGDWTLRLSRNIPTKQRWKRLFVTLAAHIEKNG